MKQSNSIVNPHAKQPISLLSYLRSLWRNRRLIIQMSKREVVGRYKGSVLGLAWSFFNPVFMLVVYTFVFSVIFKSRWGGEGASGTKTEFAIVLFVGMIVQGIFAELLNRAPTLILSNINYVKKVIFPLEILPIVALFSTLFHSFVSLAVLLSAFFIFNGYLNWTVIFIPIVLFPLIVLVSGLALILASLGVFLRDVGQTVSILTMILMFLAPVFYPISAVPANVRGFIMANPVTFIIEQGRDVLIWGKMPDLLGLFYYFCAGLLIFWIGYIWFQKTRKGFADVL